MQVQHNDKELLAWFDRLAHALITARGLGLNTNIYHSVEEMEDAIRIKLNSLL
jgi:hypothetical protein